jgi:ABC-type multidrug transport system fused ATPase/permease subunit
MISHRWLDETPTGRIIARCTQDIRAIDGPVPEAVVTLAEIGITLVTKLVVVIIFTPIFMLPSMFIAIFGFFLGNLYLRAQLSVKREMRYAIAVLPLYTC